jgi:NhaP-type Na+/H+ or K+/H+ antiporter
MLGSLNPKDASVHDGWVARLKGGGAFLETVLVVLFIGLLVFLAHLFTALFRKTQIPDVLLLILLGLILGPVSDIVRPEHFGSIGPVFSSVALILILFEGGIDLDIRILARAFRPILGLTVVNFLFATAAMAAAVMWITGFTLLESCILGSILSSVSPAVVVPLVRHLKMEEKSRSILFVESALSDVLSIVVTFAFLEAWRIGQLHVHSLVLHMALTFLVAVMAGGAAGLIWSILLNRIRTLHNDMITTPAFAFVLFGILELLEYNGYLAVLAFGVTLGNIGLLKPDFYGKYLPQAPVVHNDAEKLFFGELVFLLKTFFFVYIGISMRLSGPGALVVGCGLTALLFLVRIPAVHLAIPRSTSVVDASFMAVMVPKGLAAAVLASLPLQHGVEAGMVMQNLTYAVILFSIVGTSAAVFLLGHSPLGATYREIFSGFGRGPKPPASTDNDGPPVL